MVSRRVPLDPLHVSSLIDPLFVFIGLCSASDPRAPQGLSYHLTEIWLPELDHASSSSPAQNPIPLKLVLVPFFVFGAKTPNKTAYQKFQANLIEPLISPLSLPLKSEASCREGEFLHLLANSCLTPSDGPMDRSRLRKGLLDSCTRTFSITLIDFCMNESKKTRTESVKLISPLPLC